MKMAKWFKEKLEEFKDDPEFIAEGIILKLNEKIVIKMEELNITRAELARRLGVTKPFITKLLNGNHNLTVKTMVSIAKALECELMLDLYPKGFEQKIFYRKVTEPRDLNAFNIPIRPKLELKDDPYASAA
jgi:transcriptional regulator with XRE-family HTH domain